MNLLGTAAEALPDIDDPAFAATFDRFAGARVVLLGESTHGTSEFYTARAAITRRLVERHGFTIVGLEARWADVRCMDDHVRHRPRRTDATPVFQQFPTWMWRNEETGSFLRWLRDWNDGRDAHLQTSIHGLDVRDAAPAAEAVFDYLRRTGATGATSTERRHAGTVLREILSRRPPPRDGGRDEWLDVALAARVMVNAEAFEQAPSDDFTARWNLRDTHMCEALMHLLQESGPSTKAVIWAHNSHVGNHAYNEFGREMGMHSLGQLVKARSGCTTAAIGFGTHTGTFLAAPAPNAACEAFPVMPAKPHSWDAVCHEAGVSRFLLDLRDPTDAMLESRPQRGFGTVYRPSNDDTSDYYLAALGGQYDAWVWFEQTSTVRPLPGAARPAQEPDWPFGSHARGRGMT